MWEEWGARGLFRLTEINAKRRVEYRTRSLVGPFMQENVPPLARQGSVPRLHRGGVARSRDREGAISDIVLAAKHACDAPHHESDNRLVQRYLLAAMTPGREDLTCVPHTCMHTGMHSKQGYRRKTSTHTPAHVTTNTPSDLYRQSKASSS